MRYLAEYIDPKTGDTRMGTADKLVREYASDYNAFRYMHYHLRWDNYPPGQYRLIQWPIGGQERELGFLYKRV